MAGMLTLSRLNCELSLIWSFCPVCPLPGNALLRRLREDAGFKRTEADREPSTEDHIRMQNQVERLLRKIQQRQQEMKAYLAQRDVQLGLSMGLEELEGGIKRVS